jgi:3-oxoacyl-[acyl-carrier protein] reductase
MDLGIAGKKVLVVGGSKGLGGEISKAFNKEGCDVAVIARREHFLLGLKEEIGGRENGNIFFASDLLQPGEPQAVINNLIEDVGFFDIVIHNIGGALGVKDLFSSPGDLIKVWRFNVGISIEINNILLPFMVKKNWGRVVHMSSISASYGEPSLKDFGGSIAYAASKSYLNSYIQGIARELAKENVLVNAVMPGAVKSKGKYWDKMTRENPEMVDRFIDRHCSIGRLADPKEIASFVVFMSSQQASYATGSLVSVDGGRV